MTENMVFIDSKQPDRAMLAASILNTQLSEAIEQRAMARDLEDQAKTLKEIANETILSLAESYEITKAESVQGAVQIKKSTRTTFDNEKIKTFLVERGVAAVLVADAFGAAKKTVEFTTVDFRLPKPERG
jgi:hypothetical protein